MYKAKKSLGQNFLKSQSALRAIVAAGEVKPSDTILEIGPGLGVLTEQLLATSCQVVAIEKDPELIATLKNKFAKEIQEKKLILIEGDVLKLSADSCELLAKNYKLIANIPYYITGAILKKFLESDNQPERMVLLLQKEVAKRICGTNPASPRLRRAKESILSISVKAYGEPKYIETVKKRYFSPEPKVDSAILLIQNISKKNFHPVSEESFFKLVKAGFAHKRKILSSNLKNLTPKPPLLNKERGQGERSIQVMKLCEIPEKVRAENLSLENWLCLAKNI